MSAWLVMPLAWHLFSRGRVGDSWRLMREELTYLESVGAAESVPSLHRPFDVVGAASPYPHQLPG